MTKLREICCFEQLPNEILLHLFENYVRLIDLYLAFYPLNHRINEIIKSAHLYIDIPSKDIFHKKSFSYFNCQIVSLRVSMCCAGLDLTKMVNLRFLHLEKPTHPQLLSISADILPNLCYLSLSPCWYGLKELPRHITNIVDSCPFTHLRFFVLPGGKIVRFLPTLDQ